MPAIGSMLRGWAGYATPINLYIIVKLHNNLFTKPVFPVIYDKTIQTFLIM